MAFGKGYVSKPIIETDFLDHYQLIWSIAIINEATIPQSTITRLGRRVWFPERYQQTFRQNMETNTKEIWCIGIAATQQFSAMEKTETLPHSYNSSGKSSLATPDIIEYPPYSETTVTHNANTRFIIRFQMKSYKLME